MERSVPESSVVHVKPDSSLMYGAVRAAAVAAIVAGFAVGSGCVQSVGARERFLRSNSSAVAHRPGDGAERVAMWPVVGQSPAVAMAGTRGSDSGGVLAGVDAGR